MGTCVTIPQPCGCSQTYQYLRDTKAGGVWEQYLTVACGPIHKEMLLQHNVIDGATGQLSGLVARFMAATPREVTK